MLSLAVVMAVPTGKESLILSFSDFQWIKNRKLTLFRLNYSDRKYPILNHNMFDLQIGIGTLYLVLKLIKFPRMFELSNTKHSVQHHTKSTTDNRTIPGTRN